MSVDLEKLEEILDYCATHMIKRQVSIYPPLLLIYATSDKHRLRQGSNVEGRNAAICKAGSKGYNQ
jgi:hypothetical protein